MKPFMLRKKKKFVTVARRRELSARMGDTRDYRMTTIDSVLRRSLDDRSGALILTLDPAFQGLPETAHGGSVLAAFDALAGLTGPRHVGGVYCRRVPFALTRAHTDATHTFVLRDATGTLVDGRVASAVDGACGAPVPLLDHASQRPDVGPFRSVAPGDAQTLRVSEGHRGTTRHPLPVSRTCCACGVDSTLGLRLRASPSSSSAASRGGSSRACSPSTARRSSPGSSPRTPASGGRAPA